MRFARYIRNKGLILVLVGVITFSLIQIVQAVTADPGTDANPLVSQDYVDAKMAALSSSIDNINKQIESLQQMKAVQFEVIQLKAGQKVIVGASAEMILRSGKATAIASPLGGLSDISSGTGEDYTTGEEIPPNHLLLASRDDGRGLTAKADSYILVKGIYKIQ